MKIYRSKCGVSVNVELENGVRKHLLFRTIGKDGACLYVRDKKVQEELEKHEWFGDVFWLWRDDEEPCTALEEELKEVVVAQKKVEAVTSQGEPVNTMQEEVEEKEEEVVVSQGEPVNTIQEEEEKKVEELVFSCFDDAREYANDKWGIAKKKLMSKNAVVAAGEERGVKIIIEG